MIFVAIVFGLIVGSFLNAVIYRLHSNESVVTGRSHCVHCNHELQPFDLIPVVSFVMLQGRCRYCHKKISWQYPLIELITGLIFALLYLNNAEWILWVLTCVFIVIAVFDFKHYLILDKVVFPTLALVVFYNIFNGFFIQGLIGAVVVSGFFGLQYAISKGRWIGLGDVKLGLLLGSVFGLKASLAMLLIAYFLGAIVGVSLLAAKKKHLGSELPFGVFLSISAILMMLYGQQLTGWYFSLIGL